MPCQVALFTIFIQTTANVMRFIEVILSAEYRIFAVVFVGDFRAFAAFIAASKVSATTNAMG